MRVLRFCLAAVCGAALFVSAYAYSTPKTSQGMVGNSSAPVKGWAKKAWVDTKAFYAPKNLYFLAGGVAVNGMLANTEADQEFANWYQAQVRSRFTNDLSSYAKPFGSVPIAAAGYAGALGLSYLTRNMRFGGTFGRWTSNSLQAIVVGVPPLLILQRTLGSSRPETNDSRWNFFHSSHAASGHAFLGAVPFLTAAKMSNCWYGKTLFYGASTLTGFSRINDNKHYISQVILGWWIAYLSVNTVFHVEHKTLQLSPSYVDHGVGVNVRIPT